MKDQLERAIRKSNRRYNFYEHLIVVGDFNYNILKQPNKDYFYQEIVDKLGLNLLSKSATTDNNTLIDWCLQNQETTMNILEKVESNCSIYESFWSDHKPLFISIKKTKS